MLPVAEDAFPAVQAGRRASKRTEAAAVVGVRSRLHRGCQSTIDTSGSGAAATATVTDALACARGVEVVETKRKFETRSATVYAPPGASAEGGIRSVLRARAYERAAFRSTMGEGTG